MLSPFRGRSGFNDVKERGSGEFPSQAEGGMAHMRAGSEHPPEHPNFSKSEGEVSEMGMSSVGVLLIGAVLLAGGLIRRFRQGQHYYSSRG